MSESTIRADFNQTTNIHGNLSSEIAFYSEVSLNDLSQFGDFSVCEIAHASGRVHASHAKNFLAAGRTDSENICESYVYSLVSWEVNSRYSCQVLYLRLALPLLMLWILADYPHDTFTADYLTFITHFFY